MARTRWPPGPVTPRPLAQARQIRPAPPVGATKPGARPASRSQDSPSGAGLFGRQAGTQAPGPMPAPRQSHASAAGSREAGPGALSTSSLPNLYFSTRLIRAGAWNAYLPVLWPGRLPQLGRGRAALVTERDHVPVRHGRRGGALRETVPPDPGVARRPFLLGIDAGGLP